MRNLDYIVEGNFLQSFYLLDNVLYNEYYLDSGINRLILHREVSNFSLTKSEGIIHILLIDSKGRLVHLYKDNDKWKNNRMENINLQGYDVREMKVYPNRENKYSIDLILALFHKNYSRNYRIIHYTINQYNWWGQKIAEFIGDKSSFVRTIRDGIGNLHIIYKSKSSNGYNLLYRKYNSTQRKWSIPYKIEENSNIAHISFLWDTEDNLNLVFSSLEDANYTLNYLKKQNGNHSKWRKVQLFTDNITKLKDLVLIQYMNRLEIICILDNKIYIAKKEINENSWSNPELIKDNNKDLYRIKPFSYIGKYYKGEYVSIPIGYYFIEDKRIVILGTEDLSNNSLNNSDYMDVEIIKNKLLNLYYEMESLKNKELILFNSLLDVKRKQILLYESAEKVLKKLERKNL